MKLLFLGLIPVVIFWLVEDKFGTFWGLIAAIIWALGECIYEYGTTRKIQKLTLFSTALVVILGGLGALLDKSILFKFQPVIMEVVFAGVIIWGGRGGEPLLLKMARQTKPEAFKEQTPEITAHQLIVMRRLTRNLIVILIAHSILLSVVAVNGTTGQWVFWKGIGFNVLLLFWAGAEFLVMRRKKKLI
jgi:intracellular septation protein A